MPSPTLNGSTIISFHHHNPPQSHHQKPAWSQIVIHNNNVYVSTQSCLDWQLPSLATPYILFLIASDWFPNEMSLHILQCPCNVLPLFVPCALFYCNRRRTECISTEDDLCQSVRSCLLDCWCWSFSGPFWSEKIPKWLSSQSIQCIHWFKCTFIKAQV